MKKKYYPQKFRNKVPVSQQRKKFPVPINPNVIQGMFGSQEDKYAMRDGRVHCVSSEKTAILTDVYGNRLYLHENKTTFNTDKEGPGLFYRDERGTFGKKPR